MNNTYKILTVVGLTGLIAANTAHAMFEMHESTGETAAVEQLIRAVLTTDVELTKNALVQCKMLASDINTLHYWNNKTKVPLFALALERKNPNIVHAFLMAGMHVRDRFDFLNGAVMIALDEASSSKTAFANVHKIIRLLVDYGASMTTRLDHEGKPSRAGTGQSIAERINGYIDQKHALLEQLRNGFNPDHDAELKMHVFLTTAIKRAREILALVQEPEA